MNVLAVESRLRELLAECRLDLPLPASGATSRRWRDLQQLAEAEDLSVARLAEAHCDAVAILAEAGRELAGDALAGVWASKFGRAGVTAVHTNGDWYLAGSLNFCSGASIVDTALVDAVAGETTQLFLVPLRGGGVEVETEGWQTDALAGTATGRVRLDLRLGAEAAVGAPGFYLNRPGFWHGAVGVAACWAGGGRGVYDASADHVDIDNPHAAAYLGRAWTACWAMSALLDRAGDDIDELPTAVDMAYALTVRHLVATACREVIESCQRATGPGPLVFDRSHSQRVADLRLYIEQHHHHADLAQIGAARSTE